MTKFGELYQYCQTLTPQIKRNLIQNKVLELTGAKVRIIIVTLDTAVCRGFFLSASNTHLPLVKQNGCNIIGIARGLNRCWERAVQVKELMHLFDEKHETTASPETFEKLLSEFAQPALQRSDQIESEVKALWMMLACFCPEKDRLELKAQLEAGKIDSYSVALKLRIPEQFLPALFAPSFEKSITELIG